MSSNRTLRVNELIQRELSNLLRRRYKDDAAPITITAVEVTPIRSLDNRTIGAGRRGPVTEKLQKMFFDCVSGRSERHRDWNTPVAA